MKTAIEWQHERTPQDGGTVYSESERAFIEAVQRDAWAAATKAQLDNDDATWPRNELLPFPDDKPKEEK